MKVSIIGGAGRVGSNAAYALQMGCVVKEIALIDVASEQAEGEALDLRHGTSLASAQRIYAGGYEVLQDSDVVMVTAGLRRRPEESRLDLINRNVALFREILEEVKRAPVRESCTFFVVTNPVDVLTYLAMKELRFPAHRVLGLGTMLDSTRFRSFIGEYFDIDPTQVSALILGEHGDSMVPIWSGATVNGLPLEGLPGYSERAAQEIFERTRGSGAEAIRLKGGAGYAVASSIREVIHAMALDRKALLPVSSLQTGAFDIRDVCLSVPTVVGRDGAERHIEIALWPKERTGLQNSARALKRTLEALS